MTAIADSSGANSSGHEAVDAAQNPRLQSTGFRDVVAAAKVPGARAKVEALMTAALHTRLGRALERFLAVRSTLLAAGLAYTALFSLTAALTVGWTVFSWLLGEHPELRERVIDAVNTTLPGLLQSPEEPGGLVNPDQLVSDSPFTATSIIAFVVAVFTASAVTAFLARAIRIEFGIDGLKESTLRVALVRLLGIFAMLVSVVMTAGLTMLATALHDHMQERFGNIDSRFSMMDVWTFLIPFIVDSLVFVIMVRLVAGVRPPRKDMLQGAVITSAGAGLLRAMGSSLLSRSDDPALAAAASVVTVVLWVNIAAMIMLFACAWTANPPAAIEHKAVIHDHGRANPNYVTLSDPSTFKWLDKFDPAPTPLTRGSSRRKPAKPGPLAARRKAARQKAAE